MALIVLALWAGSLIAGWFHAFLWLIVPPLFFYVFAKAKTEQGARRFEALTGSTSTFRQQMARQNLLLVSVNIVQHCLLFGIGALAAYFLR